MTNGYSPQRDKFAGAAIVGDTIVFAPYAGYEIGLVNVTGEISSWTYEGVIDPWLSSQRYYGKFWGAAAVGNQVIFGPWHLRTVGIFDVATRRFRLPSPKPYVPQYFRGAVAADGKVFFPSMYIPRVGVFDVATEKYSMLDLGYGRVRGAAAVGNTVVFGPYYTATMQTVTVGRDCVALFVIHVVNRVVPQAM